jgi:DNA-binding XRE family transcriptional regulator
MENQNSGNYLRTHRAGLSQDEIAAVLGCEGGMVSRHETARILPPLPLALAYEVIFLIPVSQLFRGLHEAVEQTTEDRLSRLEVELGSRTGTGPQAAMTAKKLLWLMERRSTRTAA